MRGIFRCRWLVASCLLLPACKTADGIGQSADGIPILSGTLVDAERRPLAHARSTLNIIELGATGRTSGGTSVETDHRGDFRITSDLLRPLLREGETLRLLVLAGAGPQQAVVDVSRALSPGVHWLGETVMADPHDAWALRGLTDQELLSALERTSRQSQSWFDVCLQECARRGTATVRDHIAARLRQGWRDAGVLRIAQCRAERLPDPVVLDLPEIDAGSELHCRLGQLPHVVLRFTNRDPRRRTFDVVESMPPARDPSLAVDCLDDGPAEKRDYQLVPGPEGGLRLHNCRALTPDASIAREVPLDHHIRLREPGTYHLRFAWREGAHQVVDADTNELMPGLLFLYSETFTLVVAE